MNTVRRVKRQYNELLDIEGVLLTMYDGRLNLTQQVVEEVKKYFPRKVFKTVIPRTVRLSEPQALPARAVLRPQLPGSQGLWGAGGGGHQEQSVKKGDSHEEKRTGEGLGRHLRGKHRRDHRRRRQRKDQRD